MVIAILTHPEGNTWALHKRLNNQSSPFCGKHHHLVSCSLHIQELYIFYSLFPSLCSYLAHSISSPVNASPKAYPKSIHFSVSNITTVNKPSHHLDQCSSPCSLSLPPIVPTCRPFFLKATQWTILKVNHMMSLHDENSVMTLKCDRTCHPQILRHLDIRFILS